MRFNAKTDKRVYSVQSFENIESRADLKDSDKELIKACFRKNAKLGIDSVDALSAHAANNWTDNHGTRFTKPFLDVLAQTIVRRKVLAGHNKNDPKISYGRVYAARVIQISKEEALEAIGATGETRIEEFLSIAEKRDGGLYKLEVRFYILSDTELARKVQLGIVEDVSISWKYKQSNLQEVRSEHSDEHLFYEFVVTERFRGEGVELSFVFNGSQRGSLLEDRADEDNSENPIFININDSRGDTMPEILTFTIPELQIEARSIATPEEAKLLGNTVNSQISALRADLKNETERANNAESTIQSLEKAFGKPVTIDALKTLTDTVASARKLVIDDIISKSRSLGTVTDVTEEDIRAGLEMRSFDDLAKRQSDVEANYSEHFPVETQTQQENRDDFNVADDSENRSMPGFDY